MNTTYRITSYDAAIGRHVGDARLLQNVTCLNRVDAFTIYRALRVAGYDVIVVEHTEQTSGTIKNITRQAAELEARA